MVRESEVDDFDVGDIFLFEVGVDAQAGGVFGVPPEHDHDVIEFEVAVDDFEGVKVDDCLDYPADDVGCDVL